MIKPRSNPFRSSRIEALSYRFNGDGFDTLWSRLSRQSFRGALVGPKGSGKTTLLESLQQYLVQEGWDLLTLQRRPEGASLPSLACQGPKQIVTLDGAEQLGLLERRRFCRDTKTAGGLIVTSHRTLRWIPTLRHHCTTPELFIELTTELLTNARLPQPWSELELRQLFHKHQGNIREAFRDLYDEASQRITTPSM